MKAISNATGILFFLIAVQAMCPALAQENKYRVLHVMDLPPELNLGRQPSCSLEFQEEWIINPGALTISKRVEAFEPACEDSTLKVPLPEGKISIKGISHEFNFLDLPEQKAKEIQTAFLALISKGFTIPEVYDPEEQLLSVYFHEDWILDADHQLFEKRVRAISPVIWQKRQRADGEPLPDAETGYPVFYKLTLGRMDLRQP